MQSSQPEGNRPALQGRPVDTSEINSNDVLLGRGASLVRFEGNIRFRQLVQERIPLYTSSSRRKVKDEIAREVVDAVKARNGRFLRKLVSWVERNALNVPEGADCWYPVDDTVALEKVKQAFRDNSGKNSDVTTPSSIQGLSNPPLETLQAFAAASNPAIGAAAGGVSTVPAAMDPLRHQIAALHALQAQQADQNRIAAALRLLGGTGPGALTTLGPSAMNQTESERSSIQGRDQTVNANNLVSQTDLEAGLIASQLRMQQFQNALGARALAGMGGLQTNDFLLALARERMQVGNPASLGFWGQGNQSLLNLDTSFLGRAVTGNPALPGMSSAIGGGSIPDSLLQSLSARQLAGTSGQSDSQSLLNLRQELLTADRARQMVGSNVLRPPVASTLTADNAAPSAPTGDKDNSEVSKAELKLQPRAQAADSKKTSGKRSLDSEDGSSKKKLTKNSNE